MQVSLKQEDGFHLELEDYLHGLLTLASELVSLKYFAIFLFYVHLNRYNIYIYTGIEHVLCTVLLGITCEILRFVCCDSGELVYNLCWLFSATPWSSTLYICYNLKHANYYSLYFQSRLAVNSVTLGDYGRPFEISEFLSKLNGGFRLLNLKNDSLRKKFDSLKYEVKKVEEVVYDISIRGLQIPK